MSELTLTKTKLINGVWEGVLTGVQGDTPPELTLTHLNHTLEGLEVTSNNGQWLVRAPLTVECIADGIQTFVISDVASGDTLASFALLAGDTLSEDIRAEVDLLRAELDLLKRAFRRHCVETM